MSLVGTKVRNFRIVEKLGKGGMGEVYVAFDEILERKVALKAIRAEHRLSPEAKKRFLREARILSKLDQPGICRIYDFVDGEEADFLVLELIEGTTLLEASSRLDDARKLNVAWQIAEALVAAHAEGIVHRDLKPDNVMLTPDGEVKVLDFGLARSAESPDIGPIVHDSARDVESDADDFDQTATAMADDTALGRVIGTPFYMSPEQARGEQVTPASDMYSLGLTLQTLFTGKLAYDAPKDRATLMGLAREGRTRPVTGVDRDLAALIEQLKSPARAQRPTAAATTERLQRILDKPRRRRRRLAVAAVLLLVVIAGVKYTLDLRRERGEADRRRAQAEDLIEFMLGDLREKLTPVGRLDVLDDVGDKALEYFASLREAELTDAERSRLSKAMSQVGEVRVAQGDLEAASVAFEESLAIAEEVVARDPANAEFKVGLGAALFWVGSVHYAREELDSAEQRFQDYLRVSEELVAAEPDNPEWQLEVGYAHTNLAAVRERRGDLDGALRSLTASVEIKRRLVDDAPADTERRSSLANSLDWLAQTLESRGDLDGGLQARRSSLEIRRALAEADPKDMDALRLLGNAENLTGAVLDKMGRDDEALVHFHADLEIARRLTAHDSENADWRRDHELAELYMGTALVRQDRLESAAPLLRSALATGEALAAMNPELKDWQEDVAECRLGLARLELAAGKPAAALHHLDQAIEALQPWISEESAGLSVVRRTGSLLLLRGVALEQSGQRDAARESWSEALATLEIAEPSDDVGLLSTKASALIRLGRLDEARLLVRSLADSGYAATEFVTLCDRNGIATGGALTSN